MVGFTFFRSIKVIIPSAGGSPKCALVAATASRIISEATPAPSFLKAEHTYAPAHAWRTYCAYGYEVIQNARPVSVSA